MKQELLEHLVRHCVKEVLAQVNEVDDETKGTPAPPAAGQGTAEQPAIPKEKDTTPPPPSEPETPLTPSLKGVVFINPRDKSKLQKIKLQATDDAKLERDLHKLGATNAGSKVKIAISTIRAVKDALKNPSITTYLYLGKYDPNSEEVFLMSDKSLQIAKDSSIPPTEISGMSTLDPSLGFNTMQDPEDIHRQMTDKGHVQPTGIDPFDPSRAVVYNEVRSLVKKMVGEILNKK